VLTALIVCSAPARSAANDVLRATLGNGLRVVIVRNTLAPVIATSMNYLVGSDEAPAGFSGTAHAQEHMMFRGSPGLSADQLADIGSLMGGNFNANTRESLTQYLFTVPAEDLDVTRADPDFYALELGSAVLGGGFYSTRLSIDLRKNAGLVYSVGSSLQVGRTRGAYFVQYACDPQNVSKAANIVVQELKNMQSTPVTTDELSQVKALLLRRITLSESSVEDIARGLIERRELDLPLDEPTLAARHYIELSGTQVQKAFQTWIRPDDLVRVTQGPSPQ
jgi:predicted Zn-dependent peptidase